MSTEELDCIENVQLKNFIQSEKAILIAKRHYQDRTKGVDSILSEQEQKTLIELLSKIQNSAEQAHQIPDKQKLTYVTQYVKQLLLNSSASEEVSTTPPESELPNQTGRTMNMTFFPASQPNLADNSLQNITSLFGQGPSK